MGSPDPRSGGGEDVHGPDSQSVVSAFELLHALEAGEVFVDYQPIVELRTGRVRRAEALARWRHPERGVLAPARFLGLAAQRGLADALTAHVIALSLDQQRAWAVAGNPIGVSVNVSPDCLADEHLVGVVAAALDRHGVAASDLTLEVTESRSEASDERIRDCLVGLSRLGVRLSLDDFGTGDASLSRVQRWQFDEIKLDRSFVARVARDPTDRTIVAFATGLAHGLGMEITAEGVADARCLALLRDLGVDHGQGFFLGRPGDAAKVGDVFG